MFSIIYTPTEGEAIQKFSSLFRKPEGCFLNVLDQGRIHDNLARCGRPGDIDYIVVTDGEGVRLSLMVICFLEKMLIGVRFLESVIKVLYRSCNFL